MLSLKKCREILGKGCSLSDQELERLRAQLYQLGGIAMQAAILPEVGEGEAEPFGSADPPKDAHRPTGRRRRKRARRESHHGRLS